MDVAMSAPDLERMFDWGDAVLVTLTVSDQSADFL
jgi:hypothetical protein